MGPESLSDEAARLIARYIDSVEKIEILALLMNHAGRPWSIAEVLQQIQSSAPSVRARLAELAQSGFLRSPSPDLYQFAPASPELEGEARVLKQAYAERRIKFIEAIYNPAPDKLRNFSDAFKMRKDPE